MCGDKSCGVEYTVTLSKAKERPWIPAYAGMTANPQPIVSNQLQHLEVSSNRPCPSCIGVGLGRTDRACRGSRLRGNDENRALGDLEPNLATLVMATSA